MQRTITSFFNGGLNNTTCSSSTIGETESDLIDELVEHDIETSEQTKKRGEYKSYQSSDRLEVGRYASEHSVKAARRKYVHFNLPGATVRTWKANYEKELLSLKQKHGRSFDPRVHKVESVVTDKRGRPLKLGDIDGEVIKRLQTLRESGAVITAEIAISHAKRILQVKGEKTVDISEAWARSLFRRMGMTKRAVTTGKLPIPQSLLNELKFTFCNEIAVLVERHNIPPDMVINFDQTPVLYAPTGKYTMANKGSSKVAINGASDKRAMTALVTVTLSGKFLPLQLIYKGLTQRSTPRHQCPATFHVMANANHWSTEESMGLYVEKIVTPYLEEQRAIHGEDKPCLAIFDKFKAHLTSSFTNKLQALNILAVKVPANCTDFLQPLDLSINKSLKNFVSGQFNEWYSSKVGEIDLEADTVEYADAVAAILKSGVELRELSCKWMCSAYSHYQEPEQSRIITNGFKAAGISDRIADGPENADPFSDLL